jgi:hypothetical protein
MMYFPDQKVALAVQVNTSVPRNLGKPLGRVLVEAMEIIKSGQFASHAAEKITTSNNAKAPASARPQCSGSRLLPVSRSTSTVSLNHAICV